MNKLIQPKKLIRPKNNLENEDNHKIEDNPKNEGDFYYPFIERCRTHSSIDIFVVASGGILIIVVIEVARTPQTSHQLDQNCQ